MCPSGKLLLLHRRQQDVVTNCESPVSYCENVCHATRAWFESAFESADSRCFGDVQADHGLLANTKKGLSILWR